MPWRFITWKRFGLIQDPIRVSWLKTHISAEAHGHGTNSRFRYRMDAVYGSCALTQTVLDINKAPCSCLKSVAFFAAHTVVCVMCKNLTRIEWILLIFTKSSYRCVTNRAETLRTHLRSSQVELWTWVVKIRSPPTQKRPCFLDHNLCTLLFLTWEINVISNI